MRGSEKESSERGVLEALIEEVQLSKNLKDLRVGTMSIVEGRTYQREEQMQSWRGECDWLPQRTARSVHPEQSGQDLEGESFPGLGIWTWSCDLL